MNPKLKAFLIEKFQLAADADDAAVKSMVQQKLQTGELSLDEYTALIAPEQSAKSKADELGDAIATKTANAVAGQLAPVLGGLTEALKGFALKPASTEAPVEVDRKKELEEMEKRLYDRIKGEQGAPTAADLIKLSFDDANSDGVRVKSVIEQFDHTPTALVYKSVQAKQLGLLGKPMTYSLKEVNQPTERSRMLSSVWLKFQLFPERITPFEKEIIQWILHKEKFTIPNKDNRTESFLLSPDQRQAVYDCNKNFYARGHKTLLDDSTSGGEYSVPEFFDMDMIIRPTLATENIPSFVNIVPVARGSSAQNFILGRPTIAANTEGSAVTPFTTTGLIANHDTDFFRAMGAMYIGKDYLSDAHPRISAELEERYRETVALWFNEQIMAGDGTTEPQGITVASGTTDVTAGNPTTGSVLLSDVFNLLFGVTKPYRFNGGIGNSIFVMTETRYKSLRALATGVTGDTRLVFGDDIESYRLFNHPVLIEEQGLNNATAVFFQGKGYRLYIRQGLRFFREDRGDTLVRANMILIGCDLRVGGQLDLGAYAAVIDSFPVN